MDAGQASHQQRNPNVERVLKPYLIAFFIVGIDFRCDSAKQLPLYVRIFLLASAVINFVQRAAVITMIILALANSTMDLGKVSLLTSFLVSVLNSLVGQLVVSCKLAEVKRILKELNDITNDVMDNDSIFHKKALRIQRISIIFVVMGYIAGTIISFNKGVLPDLDNWMFMNASTSYFGYSSRPLYINVIYGFIQQWCLLSHLVCVGFFVVLNCYVTANFQCLRQKCLSGIRELSQKSTSCLKRTVDKAIVWSTKNPEEERRRRRLGGSQHPVWAFLGHHQALCQLVVLMNKTFREAIMIWTFSELTIVIFITRGLNIGGILIENYLEIITCIVAFVLIFLSKSYVTGAINDQVGALFGIVLTLSIDARGRDSVY